ncbi:uncharacterized protein LOC143057841 [Mytilus galloprovincialis]|uniref:uncharacterized protein LOC143057841 n=1 Tax=Mytilus galloprovincialis TaxID=29158 RepID=UPI003F7B8E42
MPKTPNRRHAHHLNLEEQREQFMQAVRNVGYDGEMFATLLQEEVHSQRRRNRGDRKLRWVTYCHWAYALKDSEIGPDDAQYAWPKEVLNYLRSLAPIDIKGEIKKVR